jgi:hypothetical protein
MTKRYVIGLLVAFVGLDLALTCWQYFQMPLDGDLAAIALPAAWYSQVLHDPFGWAVLTKNEVYSAPNRFFAHASMVLYWHTVPTLLQRVMSPINSLYAASALFATATQAALTLALAAYVELARGERAGSLSFWLTAALLRPLFQTANRLYEQIGITDQAITYTFFYAWPLLLVLGLYWPFFRAACLGQPLRLPAWRVALLVALMVVIAFNGPLASAVVAVGLLGVGLRWLWGWRHPSQRAAWLSGQALGLLVVLGLLTAYSLYIGRNNNENVHTLTLSQRYRLLPEGLARLLVIDVGLPLLSILLLGSIWLVRRTAVATPGRPGVLRLLAWGTAVLAAYLLLLPLGGYRTYRPYLVRYDTFLPVTLGMLFAYGLLVRYLLQHLLGGPRRAYLAVVLLFSAYLLRIDLVLKPANNNDCERRALVTLAQAPGPEVQLPATCGVLSWGPVGSPGQSEPSAQLLYDWGVTPSKKRYFQQ